MKSKRLRIIVTGLMAQYPLGGVAWDYFQYVLGFARLGHDVYYFEDTGQWPYNPVEGGLAKDGKYNSEYLSEIMSKYDFQEKWAYCFPHENTWYGLTSTKRNEIINTADILINVSGTLAQPKNYRKIPHLVYIDSDPVFTQLKLARGQLDYKNLVDYHDFHFSFGEDLSSPIPSTGHSWIPTRQPIVLKEWRNSISPKNVYTTIMNWTSHNDVVYKGKSYGQKNKEFLKFLDLPKEVDTINLEIAVNAGKNQKTPYELLKHKNWIVVNPDNVCYDMESYRRYIINSKGEWSVAKNGYVVGQSGWFSCRSACYLAAGRPVIVQDTGFTNIIPTGKGLFAFSNMEEAIAALKEVESNYLMHSEAALEIALKYFDSDKVLKELIQKVFENDKTNIA